jgi:hypothetical protein
MTHAITIRPAYTDDELALTRLAILDSSAYVPPAPLLLAEVEGELRAALSLCDGTVIADPFVPTASLLVLLRQAGRPAEARPRRTRLRAGRAGARGRARQLRSAA